MHIILSFQDRLRRNHRVVDGRIDETQIGALLPDLPHDLLDDVGVQPHLDARPLLDEGGQRLRHDAARHVRGRGDGQAAGPGVAQLGRAAVDHAGLRQQTLDLRQ